MRPPIIVFFFAVPALRATLFWMNLSDVISNVTLTSTPALITRQRQNIAISRSRGIVIEGDWPVWRNLRVSSGYLVSDSVVTSGDLEGKRLPLSGYFVADLYFAHPLAAAPRSHTRRREPLRPPHRSERHARHHPRPAALAARRRALRAMTIE